MLRYDVKLKPGGYTAEELKQDGAGGADAIVIASIVRDGRPPHSGPLSVVIMSVDSVGYQEGDYPDIPDTELFIVMTMMADKLSKSEALPAWQKALAVDMFEQVQTLMQNLSHNNRGIPV
jgi:hypothetical protein